MRKNKKINLQQSKGFNLQIKEHLSQPPHWLKALFYQPKSVIIHDNNQGSNLEKLKYQLHLKGAIIHDGASFSE